MIGTCALSILLDSFHVLGFYSLFVKLYVKFVQCWFLVCLREYGEPEVLSLKRVVSVKWCAINE